MPNPAEPFDVLIKIEDACRALQVSEATLRRFQGRPDWPSIVKIGRASRVRLSEVNRCIAGLAGSTRTRARSGESSSCPNANQPPSIQSSDLERIRSAAKVPGGETCPEPWRDAQLEPVAMQWRRRGLTIENIETVARGLTANMKCPPLDPRHLSEGMTRFAARLAHVGRPPNTLLESQRGAAGAVSAR